MRLLYLALFLALVAVSFAPTQSENTFTTQTSGAGLPEFIKDWRVLSMISIMISIILIGMAYAVGIGMEMPEIKAWASNELVQVFANVTIIIGLLVTIAFLDAMSQAIVQESQLNLSCVGGQSCIGNVSVAYLDSYINSAKDDARQVSIDAVTASGWAGRRFGLYCTSILCLQAGASFSLLGHFILDQDRYTMVFEYYSNLLASLEAQKFFIQHISFGIGPWILAMGVIARTFFFTRKLGGLLIAVGCGIMFFFPGMFVFDWLTLDTTLTGDKANENAGANQCPDECKVPHALAYIDDGSADGKKLGSPKEVFDVFPGQADLASKILDGSAASGSPTSGNYSGKNVVSCMTVSPDACPLVCRELPFPNTLTTCYNQTGLVPQNCAALPDKCWVRRLASPPPPPDNETAPVLSMCPKECKVVPPLKGNCNTGSCLASRPECRVYTRINYTGVLAQDVNWSPNPIKDASLEQYIRCQLAQECTPSLNALDSCAYIVPETGRCNFLCDACPEVCRVTTNDITKLPSNCINSSNNQLINSCKSCPVGCKVNSTYIAEVSPTACGSCDAEKRIITYGETMPSSYITGACDINSACKPEDRVPVPRNACEQCLFTEESQVYEPPIQPNCVELCRAGDAMPTKSAGKFSSIGAEGLAGTSEIQNVSKMMLPAYVLPLFNIVATLVFIRGLSAILGGDIEIPGLSKVF
ncbi:MAG: hypothetical protein U0R44_03180 [Candidatus Micrarchaeia archaeon]